MAKRTKAQRSASAKKLLSLGKETQQQKKVQQKRCSKKRFQK